MSHLCSCIGEIDEHGQKTSAKTNKQKKRPPTGDINLVTVQESTG